MAYCQLQTISSFSFGKSSVKCGEYVQKGKKLNYNSLSMGDINSAASFPYLYKACKNTDVKPIYGSFVSFKLGEVIYDGEVIILNERGYLNFMRLINSHKDVYDAQDLEETDGLSFILKTEASQFKEEQFLKDSNPDFFKLSKMFSSFYFGIEIYSKEEARTVEILRKFVREHSYKYLAFPKVIYLDPDSGYKAYEILKCITDKKPMSSEIETDRHPFFLLSQNSVNQIYKPEEIEATQELADSINFEFMKKRGELLKCELPDSAATLKEEVYEGINKIFQNNVPQAYLDRLAYELKVIHQMHFDDYFLIVSDYVHYAKNNDIKVGPGRGSAAGSLVSFALNITAVDPIKYGLFFERFLNPLRVTMPDIDIDFQDDKRQDLINYLRNKYGSTRVALIVTYSTLKLRSAVRQIGTVYDIPEKRITKLSSCLSSKSKNFVEEKANNYRFKKLLQDKYYQDIISKAEIILNYPINTSTHASGVILSNTDLNINVPVSLGDINVVGYEQAILEDMGYLKMDILALNHLTLISKIEKKIAENGKQVPNIQEHLNDRNTFEILNQNLLVDIPQIESYGMQQTIRQIKPTSITDISSVLALYRPGPKENIPTYSKRKNLRTPYKLVSPLLKSILRDTYGIIIYQEQILQIAQTVAGFDGGKADLLRRAISKKKVEQMEKLKKDFIQGAIDNGLKQEEAESIYSLIYEFANYGFNKSHSLAYSFITYTALYYKANYPQEFYQACLEKTSMSDKKFVKLVSEMRNFTYRVINPSINKSKETYSFEKGNFRVGLNQVKGLNSKVAECIINNRETSGEFKSLGDFLIRVPESDVSEKEFKVLIDSGAFDEFGYARSVLNDKIGELMMARNFADSETELPLMDKGETDFNIRTFTLEFNALGVVLSKGIHKLIKDPANFFSLYLIVDEPSEYNGKIIAKGITNYQSRTLFLPQGEPLHKYDIISIREEETNYANPRILSYKKEIVI